MVLTLSSRNFPVLAPRVHKKDIIMSAMASQITGVSIVCSGVCSGSDQRKHQSPASLAFVRGIHRWSVDSPHKWPVTRKMFPFHDVIVCYDRTITSRTVPAAIRIAAPSSLANSVGKRGPFWYGVVSKGAEKRYWYYKVSSTKFCRF